MLLAVLAGQAPGADAVASGHAEVGHRGMGWRTCSRQGARHYDVVVYGDEPAGVMTALELHDQLRRLTPLPRPRIALISEAALSPGPGGTIARAGLAYLDRNQVPRDMWGLLPPFAPSSQLYVRFLKLARVKQIAIDPHGAAIAFSRALRRAHIDVLPSAAVLGTGKQGERLCLLQSARYGSIGADLFIDSSLGGRLAHLSGVPFLGGIGPRSLSQESIALGWIFEVHGLTLRDLQRLEEAITRRLLDPDDVEARHWLQLWPQYRRNRGTLSDDLLDEVGHPQLSYSSTSDSADQQSPALSIAFHGEEHLPRDSRHWRARLDPANIALLKDRLSFNALLFRTTAELNRTALARHGRPLPWMVAYAEKVESFFLRHGATRVVWMPELYIRSADQIAHPEEALSAARMAAGGVPAERALGTFTYYLDFRGGLEELVPKAKPTFNFGYRHTLPRELGNLAVLGPSGGFGGLGEGAGRIIELNISVGQGLAIASALAIAQRVPLASVDPVAVARLMPPGHPPYGRPSGTTGFHLFLLRLEYLLAPWLPWGENRFRHGPRGISAPSA